MRILGIFLFEFILLFALQGFSYTIAIYALCKKKFETNRFVFVSVLFSFITYILRLLPISFGIHTVLILIFMFLISVFYLKLAPLSTIKAQLIITIVLLALEFADTFVLMNVFGSEKFDLLMNDRLYKNILGTPPSLLFALFSFLIYYLLIIRKLKKSVAYGEAGA